MSRLLRHLPLPLATAIAVAGAAWMAHADAPPQKPAASKPAPVPEAAPLPKPPAPPSATPAQEAAPAPSSVASSPPASGAKRAYVVAAIGDSLTDYKSHGGKYLEELKKRCPESQFDNYGKGGQMVNQMRKRFAHDILGDVGPKGEPAESKPPYTHVIVFGGVNDLCSDETAFRTVPKIEKDLSAMYAMAKGKGIKVVAITVTPWGGFSKFFTDTRRNTTFALNKWIRGRKDAGEVDEIIDGYAALSCGDPEKLCPDFMKPFKDGLHFGPGGHQKLGEALYKNVFSDCK
jgi:lysophospholipase L1-like esterase